MIVSDNSSTNACCAGLKKCAAGLASGADFGCGAGATSVCAVSVATAGKGRSVAPRTVAELFNHWRRSCLKSVGSLVDIAFSYRFPFFNSSPEESQERQLKDMMVKL